MLNHNTLKPVYMNTFQILAIICAVTSVFLNSYAHAQDLVMPNGNFDEMRRTGVANVIEVINPITVKLEDGRFIHLAGLDYPDLDYYEPGDVSVLTQKILTDFLKNKDVAIYQTSSPNEGRVNRMGHHIAHLMRIEDDVWAQGLILSLGLARVRTTAYNNDMAAQMLSLEDAARQKKTGIWDMEDYQIVTPDNAAEKIGSFQIVEGTVHSVSRRKNTLYLNFGNNWREDFTISISSTDMRKFTKSNIDPQRWGGTPIRVRGWLESYNGPYMEIDHPERFQVLEAEQAVQKKNRIPAAPPKTVKKGNALPKFNQ